MPPAKFTVNNVWSQTAPTGLTEELTLPSGQTCLARRLGVEGLLEVGILDNVDELTSLVDNKYLTNQSGKKQPATAEVLKDVGKIRPLITMADKALPHIVQDPVVALHFVESGSSTRALTADERADAQRRTPGVVFTDQIGLEDKVWLFDWAIGSLSSLRNFRNDTGSDVAGVANVPGVSRPAKRAARSRK